MKFRAGILAAGTAFTLLGCSDGEEPKPQLDTVPESTVTQIAVRTFHRINLSAAK